MYSIYQRLTTNRKLRLEFKEYVSLAGCNIGLIPNLLKKKIKYSDKPPIGWTINIAEHYNRQEQSVIIEIKPKNIKKTEVFLCELDKVIGFTYDKWSPIMYRLKILFSGLAPKELDKNSFNYPDTTEIVYTMLYLYGTFKDGELKGKWNYPRPSTTNALLIWPEAMTFFCKEINLYDPNFLNENIKIIL